MALSDQNGLDTEAIKKGFEDLHISIDPDQRVTDPETYAQQYERCSVYDYQDITYSASSKITTNK